MASAKPGKAIPATVLLLIFGLGETLGFKPSPSSIEGLGLRSDGVVCSLLIQYQK